MPYDYEVLKPEVLTDRAQVALMDLWQAAQRTLAISGVMDAKHLIGMVHHQDFTDDWKRLALIDRLVEIGYLKEIMQASKSPGQYRIFAAGPKVAS